MQRGVSTTPVELVGLLGLKAMLGVHQHCWTSQQWHMRLLWAIGANRGAVDGCYAQSITYDLGQRGLCCASPTLPAGAAMGIVMLRE